METNNNQIKISIPKPCNEDWNKMGVRQISIKPLCQYNQLFQPIYYFCKQLLN